MKKCLSCVQMRSCICITCKENLTCIKGCKVNGIVIQCRDYCEDYIGEGE